MYAKDLSKYRRRGKDKHALTPHWIEGPISVTLFDESTKWLRRNAEVCMLRITPTVSDWKYVYTESLDLLRPMKMWTPALYSM